MKNAKLWKRIVHEGLGLAKLTEHDDVPNIESIEGGIITAPIIVADHIEQRLPKLPDENSSYEPSDLSVFDGVCPPFEKLWVEWSGSADDPSYLDGDYVLASAIDGGWNLTIYPVMACEPSDLSDGFPPRINPSGSSFDVVDGKIVESSFRCGINQKITNDYGDQMADTIRHLAIVHAAKLLSLLMVLGCSNVSLAPRRQTDAAAAREATRRNGGHVAGYRYHVLVVRPAGSKPGTPGIEIGTMPRHMCRGHFAEYGPKYGKGKLFGKYEGRFFVPPHMKGDAKNGTVLKDYEVRA